MKKTIIALLILSFFSCATSKKVNNSETIMNTKYKNVKIAKTSVIINKDTVAYNELRFYKIDSASDVMKTMYLDYGKWNNSLDGLHQNNIDRKVWENVNLFENDETFTVIADGTETMDDYFACLIVLDADYKNCFENNHPLKDKIIDLFYQKMKKNKRVNVNSFIFRE